MRPVAILSSHAPTQSFRAFSISPLRATKEPAVTQGKQNKPKESEMKGAQPKILNEKIPSKEEESEDVRKHNEEMEKRADKPSQSIGREDAAGGKKD